MLMVGILNSKPLLEKGGLLHHSIVVYLVSTAYHDMEGFGLMVVKDITP